MSSVPGRRQHYSPRPERLECLSPYYGRGNSPGWCCCSGWPGSFAQSLIRKRCFLDSVQWQGPERFEPERRSRPARLVAGSWLAVLLPGAWDSALPVCSGASAQAAAVLVSTVQGFDRCLVARSAGPRCSSSGFFLVLARWLPRPLPGAVRRCQQLARPIMFSRGDRAPQVPPWPPRHGSSTPMEDSAFKFSSCYTALPGLRIPFGSKSSLMRCCKLRMGMAL